MLNNSRRRHDGPRCFVSQAQLGALIAPSPATSMRESYRQESHDAMLRAFNRATAPEREAEVAVVFEHVDVPVVERDGVRLAHLETLPDPDAAAEQMRRIVAEHRARLQ